VRAAIDVGTNTVRLLLGDVVEGRVEPHCYARHITRLGGGFSDKEGLAPSSQERTLFALHDFVSQCKQAGVVDIKAVGTAAFRRAVNGELFAQLIQEQTGIPLEIISGDTEALLTCSGVLSVVSPVPEVALILDIGGGSTEFILIVQSDVVWKKSYPLGVVRLCEEMDTVVTQLASIRECLLDVIHTCRRLLAGSQTIEIIGTAGSVTTLAAMDMKMESYDWRIVNNYKLGHDRLVELYDFIQPLTIEQRECLPGLEPGRGDLILPGMSIIIEMLSMFNTSCLTVSDAGLLEGLLLHS
jgi:exopolyphosphatase/guanosine-5'-triphosphate,3'-diphosphate pyrophosphatase